MSAEISAKEAFQATIIDLSLRQITTQKGEVLTLYQIESNVKIQFSHEEPTQEIYALALAAPIRRALGLEIGIFNLALINCGDWMGCFVAMPYAPEQDPPFHIKFFEQDEVTGMDTPGELTIDMRCCFDFISFTISQKVRIETIPDMDAHDEEYFAMKKRKAKQEEEK